MLYLHQLLFTIYCSEAKNLNKTIYDKYIYILHQKMYIKPIIFAVSTTNIKYVLNF